MSNCMFVSVKNMVFRALHLDLRSLAPNSTNYVEFNEIAMKSKYVEHH